MTPLHLLAGGAVLHMGYAVFPPDTRALAWNALGAAARLALLLALVSPIYGWYMGAVVGWLAAEELQVIVCNAAFAVAPWPVLPGQDMCSAWIQTDIGKLSAVAVAALLLAQPNNITRVTGGSGRG
jgi:hypothetical protein